MNKIKINLIEMSWCKRIIANVSGKITVQIIVDIKKLYPDYKIDYVQVG